jgi:YD repeat-containing protein
MKLLFRKSLSAFLNDSVKPLCRQIGKRRSSLLSKLLQDCMTHFSLSRLATYAAFWMLLMSSSSTGAQTSSPEIVPLSRVEYWSYHCGLLDSDVSPNNGTRTLPEQHSGVKSACDRTFSLASNWYTTYPYMYPIKGEIKETANDFFCTTPMRAKPGNEPLPQYANSGCSGYKLWFCPANSRQISGTECQCDSGFYAVGNQCLPVVADATCPASHPVYPGLGIKTLSHDDYVGAGAHPLSWTRSYKSAYPIQPKPSFASGWVHNYQRQLDLAFVEIPNGTVSAFRSDGTWFRLVGSNGTWQSKGPDRAVLTGTKDASDNYISFSLQLASDDSIETYDGFGKLLSIKARNGWLTSLTYSDTSTPAAIAPKSGLLIAIKNHFGRELKLAYDTQGRIVTLTTPGSAITQYGYDAQGRLSTVTWPDNAVRRYVYEDARLPAALTGVVDEAGVRAATYSYDQSGRAISSELAGGTDRYTFQYLNDSQTTITAPDGSNRTYSFQRKGAVVRPTAVTAPCPLCGSTAASTTYDADNNKTKEVAHDGTVAFYAYDAKGRETQKALFAASYASSSTRPALNLATSVTSTQWHATWNLPVKIAEPRKITAFTYDAKGNLTGRSETITTDATGALAFTAARDMSQPINATGYSYNATTQLLATVVEKETLPNSTTAAQTGKWNYVYDALGNVTSIKDVQAAPNVAATFTSYDAGGMPLTGKAKDGRIFSMSYGADSKLRSLSFSDGYQVGYIYNAQRKLIEANANDGGTARLVYDAAGKVTSFSANGEFVVGQPSTSASIAGRSPLQSALTTSAVGTTTAPGRPIPMPDVDWGDAGKRLGGWIYGMCPPPIKVLILSLAPASTATCGTTIVEPEECKDPCPGAAPSSNAARREALRQIGLPVESSVPVASNLLVPGFEQYVYWDAANRRFVVLSHHPIDQTHKCPHWHAAFAKMTSDTGTSPSDIDKFSNGAWRYINTGSVVVQHKKGT